jgi:hypothetical protein
LGVVSRPARTDNDEDRMKIRGAYVIQQVDRAEREEVVRDRASQEIGRQLADQIMALYGEGIIKEEAEGSKFPYGRYYIDVDVTLSLDELS